MKNKKNQHEDTRFSSSEQGKRVIKNFRQQLRVANRTDQTVRNYIRSIEALMNFHDELPENLDVDQIIDFLHDLKIEKERNWRTIKIYVAGIRWYYQHVLNNEETAMSIPYPKEEKSLPQILSREELSDLFNACSNQKHRVMFRLMYSSGLRRGELIRLTPENIDTTDGKCRIRILKSKGNSDFLFYTPNVARKFRGKFLFYLHELYKNNQLDLNGKAGLYKHKKQRASCTT